MLRCTDGCTRHLLSSIIIALSSSAPAHAVREVKCVRVGLTTSFSSRMIFLLSIDSRMVPQSLHDEYVSAWRTG
ncbi:hypothetical protein BJY00DRAFT_164932 [Aspergillus carlsbadensis]|nr:hypothetical protein BJY00DRAFT_164932 [Aspergillus carlsbadensis]